MEEMNNVDTELKPKIEKINLKEIREENKKIKDEEVEKAFQNEFNNIFNDFLKKMESVPPEVLDNYLDSTNVSDEGIDEQ